MIDDYEQMMFWGAKNTNKVPNEVKGKRYNQGKIRFDLIDPTAMKMLAEVLTFGAEKYDPDNWRLGLTYTNCIASLERHLNSFKAGVDHDFESGLHHVGHILCNAMFLAYFTQFRPDLDDRPICYRNKNTSACGDD